MTWTVLAGKRPVSEANTWLEAHGIVHFLQASYPAPLRIVLTSELLAVPA